MEDPQIDVSRDEKNATDSVASTSYQPQSSDSQRSTQKKQVRLLLREGLEPAFTNRPAIFQQAVRYIIQEQQQDKQFYVIHPYSYIRIAWDLLMITFSMITLTVLPFGVAYYQGSSYFHWIIANTFFDAFFIGDIAVNFMTGYEDTMQFKIIMDRRQVAVRYLKKWFAFDIASSVPIDVLYYSACKLSGNLSPTKISINKYLSLMRILRLFRLCRYAIKLEKFMEFTTIYLNIMNLLVIIFLVAHWVACIQFLVISEANFPNGSWVDLMQIQDSPVYVQYTHSMFKSLSQMIAVGYGSITPIETLDIILTMLTCSLGSFFYATFIGFLSSIISSVYSRRAEFNHKLAGVCEFMQYKNVPQDLKSKIVNYYERCYPSHFFDETEILRELSPALRKELLMATYKPLVNSVPFLANLRTSILYRIVKHLKHEIFMAGDHILEEGADSPGIFFLYRGMVDVLDSECHFIKRMTSGFYFGDISILINKPNITNVVARETSEVYMLPRSDFQAIIQRYPESFKKLYEDADGRHKTLLAAIHNTARIYNQMEKEEVKPEKDGQLSQRI